MALSEGNSGNSVFVADQCKEALGWALAFSSVLLLLQAGEVLKQAGLEVLVVPRRAAGCGVLLLVESGSVARALSILSSQRIEPVEVLPYAGPAAAVLYRR